MTPRHLVSAILVCILIGNVVSISLPSLFGTTFTKEDVKKETAKEDVPIEYQDHTKPKPNKEENPPHEEPHKPTRPPLLLGIPHPADHHLHPHNRPDHPLHPDNLPHLPSLPSLELPPLPALPQLPALPPLPSLPHFTRETIHATKTVFVEVTDKVTVHPVCMTVHKVTPPCLPYHPHHWRKGEAAQDREEVDVPAIEPTAAPQQILPSAVAAGDYINLEPTRILGGEFTSDVSPEPSQSELPAEARGLELEGQRSGRWVELTPPIKVEEAEKVKDDQREEELPEHSETPEGSVFSPINMVQQLINRSPATHYKTKTLWVTKVEKVLDTRVTATLVAKNCIPTNSDIPYCAPHGGLLGPGYHGGAFLEVLGGVLGGLTDKEEAQESGSAVQDQNNVEPQEEAAESVKNALVDEDEEEATTEREEVDDDKLESNTDSDQVKS